MMTSAATHQYNFFQINNNFNHDNFNQLFSDFIEIIKSAIDHHAPFIKLSGRQHKLKQKPWISSTLLKFIKTKQKLYITHIVNGSLDQKFYHKSYANKLNKIKLAAKKRYYLDELQKYRYNAFRTWNTIKSLLLQAKFLQFQQKLKLVMM